MVRDERDVGRINTESEQTLGAQEAIEQLLQLRGHVLDLIPVLTRFNPDHVHWKKPDDIPQEGTKQFDPGQDLYRWLLTRGFGAFLKQKLHPDPNVSFKEASRRLYEQYFRHYGIEGEIGVFADYALLDYTTGARIDPHPHGAHWPAHNVVRLFPEVDFRIGFDCPAVSDELRGFVSERVYVLVNTSKVDDRRYRPHLLGYWGGEEETDWINIKRKGTYLQKIDTWLRRNGVPQGMNGLVVVARDQSLIRALLEARV